MDQVPFRCLTHVKGSDAPTLPDLSKDSTPQVLVKLQEALVKEFSKQLRGVLEHENFFLEFTSFNTTSVHCNDELAEDNTEERGKHPLDIDVCLPLAELDYEYSKYRGNLRDVLLWDASNVLEDEGAEVARKHVLPVVEALRALADEVEGMVQGEGG